MEKCQRDDRVFLVPEPTRRKSPKIYFLWFFAFTGLALCFLAVASSSFNKREINVLLIKVEKKVNNSVCSSISNLDKFDCHPDVGNSKKECLKRGCCYAAKNKNLAKSNFSDFPPLNVPYCYYPSDYAGYTLGKITQDGRHVNVNLKRNTPSGFPNDIQHLNLVITFIDDCTLRIKITDANKTRFEVPIPINDSLRKLAKPCYDVKLDSGTGHLIITRKSSGTIVFSSNLKTLVYADQFLQLSSDLPSPYIYGIGEHYGSFLRDVNWTRITLFNSDRAPVPNYPLYGSQPFYLSLEKDGNANGVFLLNSNAMDVILQPKPAITFRPIGGILDFFIMLGPSPANVVQQYTNIVGRTFMPPYWSLGFHLCRYGYNSLNKTRETMQRTIDAGIPLDVQWNDIDYMDEHKDFTYDKKAFKGLPKFVDDIHAKGMHYVIMTDPGISGTEPSGTYPPYDDGLKADLFIKNPNGSIFLGKVWTDGKTVYPDFSHPNAESYWINQFTEFYKEVKYDGVWIDMNEPSNFYDGRVDGCDKSSYEDPPYVPNGNLPLRRKTVCMTAKHHSTIHYNEHNLVAYREATATNKALRTIRKKRPFIISRASFSGQGTQSGHWSGDISSTWEDMRYTIPSLLNFNLYGMSMIGSDICGFNSNTTVELCARWQALGAFYPFSRNHNEDVAIEQDPVALGPVVVRATVESLQLRYSLLPYLYTLFYRSHTFGDTVIRPLFFEYPLDKNTYSIDEQFLFGPAIMILPALYPNVTSVTSYLPKGTWFHNNGTLITSNGEKITFRASETEINVVIRNGYIIPAQMIGKTTTESRKKPFTMAVTLDEQRKASGELYWDDGDSLETYEQGQYNLIQFTAEKTNLKSSIIKSGFTTAMDLAVISILDSSGLPAPTQISVNGIPCSSVEVKDKVKNVFFPPKIQNISDGLQKEGNMSCTFGARSTIWVINMNTPVSLLSPLTIVWN